MKLRLVSAAIGAVLVVSVLTPAAASAATEVGNGCTADISGLGIPVSLANAPGSPLPATVPSNGVITSWRISIIPIPPEVTVSETLKIFRPTGSPGQFQVIGESAPLFLASGPNSQATRISVAAGDHIGGSLNASGETGGLYCKTENPGDRVGVFSPNPPNGSTATLAGELSGLQVPIVVVLEPDADNDGYGDETQDGCPQSATTQAACPVVTLSTTKQVRKGSVVIVVTTDTPAPVTVKGVVKLGKGKKAKLNGGTKSLTPGVLGKFTLKFTKKVKAKLAQLSPKQKLTLKATITGTSVSGAVTKKTLKVKLKGQAKG
ncbi:MAG TPA: hypothetical protein VNC16_08600 [Solirubrobacterales bacterium]|nr:hypothetical protein [Solirubrobacterales bacterium]